ncbi:hypothetical protein CPB84DRAFT_1774050 [Gymnopilus junonius]|uniref:Uncharacterized protein n=1 Tax=Gymnopilus junonius TaxID=109634 RepID=A0A9P5NR89_GYMJU|nr:hypothetical protein CPB84DRAFT_1774050 [Gymnopilus junonius]
MSTGTTKQGMLGASKAMKMTTDYTKVECWDDNGKPHLVEYIGSGKLKGQTAIVTGGASGVGCSAAIMFAHTDEAKDAKRLIEQSGATCNTVCTDLMDSNACKNVVDSHMKAFGKLNVLVNNASKQMTSDKFENIDLHNVENTFKANVIQMFAMAKFALPHMKRGASIINTSSVVASKGAGALGMCYRVLHSLSRMQMMSRGIRVNAVAPGPVNAAPQAGSRAAESMEAMGSAMGIPCTAGMDSNIITGQVIHVHSGMHIGSS